MSSLAKFMGEVSAGVTTEASFTVTFWPLGRKKTACMVGPKFTESQIFTGEFEYSRCFSKSQAEQVVVELEKLYGVGCAEIIEHTVRSPEEKAEAMARCVAQLRLEREIEQALKDRLSFPVKVG